MTAAATRKGIVPADRAAALVQDWLTAFPADPGSAQAVLRAVAGARDGLASYRDALLIASAAEADCSACRRDRKRSRHRHSFQPRRG